ncbi:MAG: hypothetical protein GEU71_14060 [Actinobacteria bacterium]|nr:hypothetical protein [Actinomycetota bacterium]
MLVLSIGYMGCGNGSQPAADNNEPVDARPEAEVSSPSMETCPYVARRPTYLPWLEAGGDVPPPQKSYLEHEDSSGDPSPSSAHLMWIPPDGYVTDGKSPYNVVLVREDELRGGPGEATGISIDGVEGLLYRSGHPGEAAILWNLDDEPCNLISLRLQAGDVLTQGQAEKEILRIADSMQNH